MDSHKSTVLALSLSVLTLAVVSTFLSLNQSGVLGDSTSAVTPQPVKQVAIARPIESGLCREVQGLFNNYCLKGKDGTTNNTETGMTPEDVVNAPFAPREDENNRLGGVCGDIYKLTSEFCPKVSPGLMPSTTCKYGVNSFSFGTACKTAPLPIGKEVQPIYRENTYTSAKYTCYDGKEGTVSSPNTSCVTESVLRELARKACEGHSICKNPEKPTGRPEEPKHCTGDKDCNENESCLLPIPVRKVGSATSGQPEFLAFGRCVPKPRVTINPRLTPKVSVVPTIGELSCTWCGTSCIVKRPGLKCPMISAPAGKDCVAVGKSCKVVDLKD